MSILNKSIPATQPSDTEKRAKNLVRVVKSFNDTALSLFEQGISALWDAEDPQAVIDHELIGTDAKELFDMNTDIVALLTKYHTIKEGDSEEIIEAKGKVLSKIQTCTAKIQPHTLNQDGTVTINQPE
jgi:hypothetical protein